jgi:hypothetical protein
VYRGVGIGSTRVKILGRRGTRWVRSGCWREGRGSYRRR